LTLTLIAGEGRTTWIAGKLPTPSTSAPPLRTATSTTSSSVMRLVPTPAPSPAAAWPPREKEAARQGYRQEPRRVAITPPRRSSHIFQRSTTRSRASSRGRA
jgi:hypothetical protein